MTTLSSPCWYCAEYQPIIGHDLDYHLVCDQCQVDLPNYHQITPLIALTSSDPEQVNNLSQAQQEYASKLADFRQQRDQLLNFYDETKTLPWRLLPGYRPGIRQPTWSDHYSAAVKNLALLQDHFDHIKSYLDLGLSTKVYPQCDLTPPGQVVKVKTTTTINQVVVSHHYLPMVVAVIDLLPQATPDHVVKTKVMVEAFTSNPRLTLTWLTARPQWLWQWSELHRNPNFDITWVEAFPEQAWSFDEICLNKDFQFDWLSRHPKFSLIHYLNLGELAEDYYGRTDRLTLANLELLLTTTNWDQINTLALCQYIDLKQSNDPEAPEAVVEFLHQRHLLNHSGICRNATLPWNWLEQAYLTGDLDPSSWNWQSLSSNPAVNAAIFDSLYRISLQTGRKTHWQLAELSRNPGFSVAWSHSDWFEPSVNDSSSHWSRYTLSSRATLEVILARPNWPWQVQGFGSNPNFQPSWIQQLPGYDWNQAGFDRSNIAKFTWSELLAELALQPENLPWFMMSSRADLTWDVIRAYPKVFNYWRWYELCLNPRLAWSDDPLWTENRDKWDFAALSQNPALDWARFTALPREGWRMGYVCANSMIVL